MGIQDDKLRLFTPDRQLVPTPTESAKLAQDEVEAAQQQIEMAQQQIEAAQQQIETEHQQAEKQAAKLRDLGIDPNTL